MQRNISLLLILATVVAVLVLLWTKPKPEPIAQVMSLEVVRTVAVQERRVPTEKLFYGRLEPVKTSRLGFEVSGVLSHREREVGETVMAKEVLLRLRSDDFVNALAIAKNELQLIEVEKARYTTLFELAEKRRALQSLEVERQENLDKQSLLPRSSLDAATRELARVESESAEYFNARKAADIKYLLAATHLRQARENLQKTFLRAPYNGVINSITAEEGDYVNRGQTVLVLADVSSLAAVIHVANTDLAYIQVNSQVPITAKERNLSGRVHSVQSVPDSETLTHEVRIYCSGEGLSAGDIVQVKLSREEMTRVLTVPDSAVQYEGGAAVFVENNGTLRRVPVRLGARLADTIVIEHGLVSTARVVVEGVRNLQDGQKVLLR